MNALTPVFSTREQVARYDRARLRGLAYEARENRAELAHCVVDLVHALSTLKDAGMPKADILDAAAGLRDAISDTDHKYCLVIDEAGETFDKADLSELDAIIEECRK